MCGITACYATSPNPCDLLALKSQLQASISTLRHRGPDSTGIYLSDDGRVGLGHARLSIIDIHGGQQPMHDSSGYIHAVVNGELYDYDALRQDLEARGCIFQTFSDSELVIHLYKTHGFNLVHHLRGEFAFVIYDSSRKLLFAVRDRFGIKPLYYSLMKGRLLIASEMKALRAFGWQARWDVESVLQMGEYSDNRTIFEGVFKLPPAHQITFRRTGHLTVQPYWDNTYPHPEGVETRSADEMIQGFRNHLVDSVRARLRSDVPLAIFLSGGIDSAAIAGIASSLLKEKDPNAKLTTFTLSFPELEALDEGPVAQRTAEFIGADINMLKPSVSDLLARFDQCVYHIEQPVPVLHATGKFILSEHARENGYKVVLTGEGSDEVLGGYSFHLLDYLRAVDTACRDLAIPLPSSPELSFMLKTIESRPLPQDHTLVQDLVFNDEKTARDMFGGIFTTRVCGSSGPLAPVFSSDALKVFGYPNLTRTVVEGVRPEARHKANNGSWHPLNTALYISCNTILPVLLNQLGDRTEMANSIEGRPPFLDHKLVEYVNGLPPSMKIMPFQTATGHWGFTEKWILREAVKPYITEEIYLRQKSQYNTPLAHPVINGDGSDIALTPLQAFIKDRVRKEKVEKLGWANWDHISELLKGYLESPEYPEDGGLDKRGRVLLWVLSLIILQEKFEVPKASF